MQLYNICCNCNFVYFFFWGSWIFLRVAAKLRQNISSSSGFFSSCLIILKQFIFNNIFVRTIMHPFAQCWSPTRDSGQWCYNPGVRRLRGVSSRWLGVFHFIRDLCVLCVSNNLFLPFTIITAIFLPIISNIRCSISKVLKMYLYDLVWFFPNWSDQFLHNCLLYVCMLYIC